MQTFQTANNLSLRAEQAHGRKRSTRQQTQERTPQPAQNGFLKQQFLPLYQPSEKTPRRMQAEKSFFSSLGYLSQSFKIEPMDVSGYGYPYNILLAHWDAVRQLNTTNVSVELDMVSDQTGRVNLCSKQQYDTGEILYFIPVIPLCRLMKDKKKRHCAELLLSVFAYLFRKAGIPYYRDDYSAAAYYYEIMQEWIDGELEYYQLEEYNSNVSELYAAEYYGEVMLRRMYHSCHLTLFAERLAKFKPRNSFERQCLMVAREAFSLMTTFSDRSIFQNTRMETDEMDEDECIRAEQCVSFIADNEGWVFGQMCSMINNEFNECAQKEEPTIVQVFNSEQPPQEESLEFEQRLFPLIHDLISILNEIP
jgi:hypothetical protein